MIFDDEGIACVAYDEWREWRGLPGVWCYRTYGRFYVYAIGFESAGGAGSEMPPPSLQNRDVVRMYAARDSWVCHLCGGQIEDGRGLHAPSVDHLTPRKFGGTDYPTNLRAAHLSCNKGRGARPLLAERASSDSRPAQRVPPPTLAKGIGREGKGRELEGKGRLWRPCIASLSSYRARPATDAMRGAAQ